MPVVFKTSKIAGRAQSDPLLYEILRDLGRSITDRIKGTPGAIPVWETNLAVVDSPLSVDGDDLVLAGSVKGSLTKDLLEGTDTPFVSISLAAGQYVAGECIYAVEASDGVDYQCRTGRTRFVAVNKSPTITASINEVGTQEVVLSSALLTVSNTIATTADTIILRCKAASTLSQTLLRLRYRLDVVHNSATITPL